MDKQIQEDIYFIDAQTALLTALQNNEVETIPNHPVKALQLCYYAGEEKLESTPKNCIHVPLENVYNYFVTTKNRFPKQIRFDNTSFTIEEKKELTKAITSVLEASIQERNNLINLYSNKIKDSIPNFNEKKLRIFIPTIRESTVLKHVARNIADAFEDIDHEVFYYHADELGDQNLLPKLYYLSEFNPHIYITIDFIENQFINEHVFNFCWFQDPMPILYNQEKINVRERDYFFYLFNEFKEGLLKKEVPKNKILLQNFATNLKIFFNDNNILKENKIVFLGSNYNTQKNFNLNKNIIELLNSEIDKGSLSYTIIKKYSKKFNISEKDLEVWIIPSLVRKKAVQWMCRLKNISIEVYGSDSWLEVPEVRPFYKGLLPYGKEMAKVYNSAKYAIAAHSQYKYQQRVIEMSACGTIPIIYNCDLITEKFYHDKNVLLFSTFEELKSSIGKIPQKDPIEISKDISYKNMAEKIISLVNNTIKD